MSSRFSFLSNLPKGVWLRVCLILSALCAVKCGILFSLRKELFQIHWRTVEYPPNWINVAAFSAFVVLVGLNLQMFARKCAARGVSPMRTGLALVGLFAALFIVLTFHEGNRNYLSPVLNGTLKWSDLSSYFAMNLFFRPPYLAAWILGLAAVYYGLVRAGRERSMPWVAAVTAACYLGINLRELAGFRAELLVLDALGLVCLALGSRTTRPLKWPVAFLPLCLMPIFFVLFSGFDPFIARPNPEFLILGLSSMVLFGGASLFAWRRGILDGWSWLLPIASATFLLLTTANFHLADNYRYLLMSGLTLPRYFTSELVFGGLLVLSLALAFRYRPHVSLVWWDVVGFIAVTMAVIDWRLVQIMGVRLDWQVLAFGDSPKMMWRMAKPYLPMLLLAVAVMAVAYWLLLLVAEKLNSRLWSRDGIQSATTLGGLCGGLLLGFAGLLAIKADKAEGMVLSSLVNTSPWWKRLSQPMYSKEKFASTARELGMDSLFRPAPPPDHGSPRELNVVLVFMESSYNEHLSLFGCTNETQPLLSKYRDRMEMFPNFFSSFASSIHARFATFTGLYPVADFKAFTKDSVPVTSLFEVLNSQGYECSMFYSSFFDYTNFRDLLRNRGLSLMYDADTMPGERSTEPVSWGLKEEETLAAIQRQIRNYSQTRQKFFLTYVPAAPHYPFDGTPQQFRKYKPDSIFDYTPRYLNELLYMDWVIASILDELKETGLLDRTLVVITSDHGELLGGEKGDPIGHGWLITPQLANVPLIIMDPSRRTAQINPVVGSQVDLLPSILDILNVPIPEDQLYQGVSLRKQPPLQPRTVYINSLQQYAALRGNVMSCGDRISASPSSLQSYRLGGDNGIPEFTPVDAVTASADIKRFDQFQENFLRHYSEYVLLFRSPQPTVHQARSQ